MDGPQRNHGVRLYKRAYFFIKGHTSSKRAYFSFICSRFILYKRAYFFILFDDEEECEFIQEFVSAQNMGN